MRVKILTIFAIPAWLGADPGPVAAQEPPRRVSMEEALQMFAQNSLELRIARSRMTEALGEARQSRAYANPSASFVREELGRGEDDYWETTVGLGQTVEWPGRTVARSRAAARRIDAARARVVADSIRLAFEVRRAYVRGWAAEERAAALAAAAEVIRDAVRAGEAQLAEGDISGYALRRLRVERARMEQALAAAELERSAVRRDLAALTLPEGPVTPLAPAAGPRGTPPDVDLAEALAAAEQRPDIRAAAHEAEAAGAAARAAALGWLPELELNAGYKEQADGFSGPVFGALLPLPLFDRRGGAAEAAEASRAAADQRLSLTARAVENDLRTSHERYTSARARLESIGDTLLADSEGLLEIATVAYGEGEMTLVELLDAAEAYRDARTAAAELRAEAWTAYYELLRAMARGPEDEANPR